MPNGKSKRGGKGGRRKFRSPKLPLTLVPPQAREVAFVATDSFAITESAAGTGATLILSLNNAFDVLTAVGGPTAGYFASISSMYRYYRVMTARIRVTAFVSGTSVTYAEACLVPLPQVTTISTNPKVWAIQRMATCKATTGISSASGAAPIILDKTYSIPQLFNVTKTAYLSEDNYRSVFNGSPANQMYCAITIFGVNSTVTTLAGKYTVSFRIRFESPAIQTP